MKYITLILLFLPMTGYSYTIVSKMETNIALLHHIKCDDGSKNMVTEFKETNGDRYYTSPQNSSKIKSYSSLNKAARSSCGE